MARYLGPKLKLSRREGWDLSYKSCNRDLAGKCKFKTKPGEHGKHQSNRHSSFSARFREKQKLKRFYGLTERQFLGCVRRATKRHGNAGVMLLQILSSRLDNVVYRMKFCTTRAEARQIVCHRFVLVNGRIVNIPSYHVRPADKVTIRDVASIRQKIDRALVINEKLSAPDWLDVDPAVLSGTVKAMPCADDIRGAIDDSLVLEFYSGLA